MQICSFIDNSFYEGSGEFVKLNPYTLETQHKVKSCDLMGVVLAIQAANKAFAEFRTSNTQQRRLLVHSIKNVLIEKAEHLAQLEAGDQALPLNFVKQYSIRSCIENIERHLAESELVNSGYSYSPVGVAVIAASWNLSLRTILDRLIPALLAGNAVVVKVSSESPVTAALLAEIIQAAQIPKGLINVIASSDPEVKKTLISHPGVRAVSFVGRIENTLDILPELTKSSLQGFKKIQISSGTKNSAVALGSPDQGFFDEIMNSFVIGQGQLAWNSARLFVLEKYEDEWNEKINDYLSRIKPSESVLDDSAWTPCLKRSSFEKFDSIKKTAYDDKAKLLEASFKLTDAQKNKYLPPVFTKDMSRCSTLQQDQIHSPFYILSVVKYPFDVAKYSNVSYFGFAAHLWGEPEKLDKVADALDVGLVTYNKSSVNVAGAVAGVKQSGFGLQDFQSFGAFYSNVKKLS